MKQLVRENVYEKFTADFDDAVADMGIGGFSYETLRKGAIVTPKEDVHLSSKNTGKFTYPGSGIGFYKGHYYIITLARDYILQGQKLIKIYKSWREGKTLEEVKKLKEQYKESGEMQKYRGEEVKMIVNKRNFDKRFEIVEQGF